MLDATRADFLSPYGVEGACAELKRRVVRHVRGGEGRSVMVRSESHRSRSEVNRSEARSEARSE